MPRSASRLRHGSARPSPPSLTYQLGVGPRRAALPRGLGRGDPAAQEAPGGGGRAQHPREPRAGGHARDAPAAPPATSRRRAGPAAQRPRSAARPPPRRAAEEPPGAPGQPGGGQHGAAGAAREKRCGRGAARGPYARGRAARGSARARAIRPAGLSTARQPRAARMPRALPGTRDLLRRFASAPPLRRAVRFTAGSGVARLVQGKRCPGAFPAGLPGLGAESDVRGGPVESCPGSSRSSSRRGRAVLGKPLREEGEGSLYLKKLLRERERSVVLGTGFWLWLARVCCVSRRNGNEFAFPGAVVCWLLGAFLSPTLH